MAIKNMTPHEKWTGKRPDISHIQEFGAPVWVLKEMHQNKLDSKSKPHIFVGYEDGPSTIRYYDATTKKDKTSHNYHFPLTNPPNVALDRQFEGEKQENKLTSDTTQTTTNKRKCDSIDESTNKRPKTMSTKSEEEIPLPDLLDDPESDEANDETNSAKHVYTAFAESNMGDSDPKTLKEAMASPQWPKWEKAIKAELDMLNQMGTWELADAPEDRKPITNKWVFV